MSRAPSPLDAFFTARSPLDVLQAVRALGDLSHGAVTSSRTLSGKPPRPVSGGVLGEDVFGVDADARAERWGHVELPVPLFHPACIAAIAELSGLTVDVVEAMARCEAHLEGGEVVRTDEPGEVSNGDTDALCRSLDASTGTLSDALRAAGFAPSDLLVRRIPVTPPADRPSVRAAGGHERPHARSVAYATLVWVASRVRRLGEAGAPLLFLRLETRSLQAVLDGLFDPGFEGVLWVSDDDDQPAGAELPASAPEADVDWFAAPDPGRPIGAAFVGESELLVQFPHATAHLDRDGRVIDVFDAPACHLVGVDAEGRHALFHRDGFHVRDLVARAWIDAVPAAFPAVIMSEALEQAFLHDTRKQRQTRLGEVADYPVFGVLSPDGRHLWVEDKEGSGGIYDTATGRCEATGDAVRVAAVPNVLSAEGRLDEDAFENPHPDYPTTHALVLAPHDRFLIADGRAVTDGDDLLVVLAAPAPVVAFAADARSLLAVRRDHAAVVMLDPVFVSCRVPLADAVAQIRARAPGDTASAADGEDESIDR